MKYKNVDYLYYIGHAKINSIFSSRIDLKKDF